MNMELRIMNQFFVFFFRTVQVVETIVDCSLMIVD